MADKAVRSSAKITITDQHYQELIALFGRIHNIPIVENNVVLTDLMRVLKANMLADPEYVSRAIQDARNLRGNTYTTFEEDAAISEAQGGTWVGAWVFVPGTLPKKE